jgi:hypothetical protein
MALSQEPPPPPPVAAPPLPPPKLPRWIVPVVGACLVAFLATLHREEGWSVLIHYGAIVMAVVLIGVSVGERTLRTWPTAVAAGLGLAAALTWAQFDYWVREWSEVDESGVEWFYTDYYGRGAPIYYRELHRYSSDVPGDDVFIASAEGGFSESGKQHGPWKSFEWRKDQDSCSSTKWLWYGEEITEGEWHVRNR